MTNQPSPAPTAPREPPLKPFRLLGHNDGLFFYVPRIGGQIVALTAVQHVKLNLLRLAPMVYWEEDYYREDDKGKGTMLWDHAASDLMHRSYEQGTVPQTVMLVRDVWTDTAAPKT